MKTTTSFIIMATSTTQIKDTQAIRLVPYILKPSHCAHDVDSTVQQRRMPSGLLCYSLSLYGLIKTNPVNLHNM